VEEGGKQAEKDSVNVKSHTWVSADILVTTHLTLSGENPYPHRAIPLFPSHGPQVAEQQSPHPAAD
jgi:hypothetical protein